MLDLFVLSDNKSEAMLLGVRDRKRPTADSQFAPRAVAVLSCKTISGLPLRARATSMSSQHTFEPQPSSQRFHHRFFGGESPGIALITPTPFFFAVLNFLRGKNPVTETLADPRIFQSFLNPFDFNQIHTNAKYHETKFARVGRVSIRP